MTARVDTPEVTALARRLVENNRVARAEQDERMARLTQAFISGQPLFEALEGNDAGNDTTTDQEEDAPA